jgi:hypothetical protein
MAFFFVIELHLCIYVSLVTKASSFFPTLGHLNNSKISWIHIRKKNQSIHDVFSNKKKNFPPILFYFILFWVHLIFHKVAVLQPYYLYIVHFPLKHCNVILSGHHHKENMDRTPKILTFRKIIDGKRLSLIYLN